MKVIKKNYGSFFTQVEKALQSSTEMQIKSNFPLELLGFPYGEELGMVLETNRVKVRGIANPYNASIVERGDHYLLFFRFDRFDPFCPQSYYTHIGCAELDRNFAQTQDEYKVIDTRSQFSEDPRILPFDQELCLVYNDLTSLSKGYRAMHVASLEPKTLKTKNIALLDPGLKPVEKNWVPFVYGSEDASPSLLFEYSIAPHRIFQVDDLALGGLIHLRFKPEEMYQSLMWPSPWGEIRGGTPARKVGDQYLAFFHSCFKDRNMVTWYVMGAYTFEARPPFRVTGISNFPILFKGIYDTPPMNTACINKRVIFPCGFSLSKKGDKEVVHLSCGENDCGVKIVTLDLEELLKSMKKL